MCIIILLKVELSFSTPRIFAMAWSMTLPDKLVYESSLIGCLHSTELDFQKIPKRSLWTWHILNVVTDEIHTRERDTINVYAEIWVCSEAFNDHIESLNYAIKWMCKQRKSLLLSVLFVKWRVLIGEIIFLMVCFSYALFLISSIYDGTSCEL